MEDEKALSAAMLLRLEPLLSGLTDGILLADVSGGIQWANRAALAMHGADRMEDLGRDAEDYCRRFTLRYRNNHRLGARDYPLVRAVAGESFEGVVIDVTRGGETEARWTHEARAILIDDAEGEALAIGIVLKDVTAHHEAEERFEATFQANPAPAIIMRLSDQRFVKVNRGFLEMTGFQRDAVVGKSIYELDLLARVDDPKATRAKLVNGESVPQMEAEIALADGGAKLAIVAGQPIELGDEAAMLLTFADLEPRRRAETSLRQSEARFAAAFRLAPTAIAVASAEDWRLLDVNDAFNRLTGQTRDRAIGKTFDELELWNDGRQRARLERELDEHGGFHNCDARIVHRGGGMVDTLVSAQKIVVEDRPSLLWQFHDISARRHTELELIEAIEAVMKDTSWFSRTVMEKLANLRDPKREGSDTVVQSLSAREREVLELVCAGEDDPAIADRLGLSRNTVRNHVAKVYAKIGVKRRSAAVVWARERGIAARPIERSEP